MQFLTITFALWAAGLVQAGSADCDLAIECSNGIVYTGCKALQECEAAGGTPEAVKRSPILPPTCDIAIKCSNGNTYSGCDAVEQCEAAGGQLVPLPSKRDPVPQLTCELIVFCSNGVTYRGCDALEECEDAGGVSCGGEPCETSKVRLSSFSKSRIPHLNNLLIWTFNLLILFFRRRFASSNCVNRIRSVRQH